MHFSVVNLPLNSLTSTSLNALIPQETVNDFQAFYLTKECEDLALSELLCNEAVSKTSLSIEIPNNSLELIVLGETPISTLVEICQRCGVSIVGLHAKNQRLEQSSYRFSITCDDLDKARQQLTEIALKTSQEMIIIEQAPLLARGGLLVMDMDSTTIEIECIDEIATLAGVGEEVSEVTELAMQGKLDFAQSLTQRVAKLKGANECILSEVADNLPLMPGLETLIKELKKYNWRIAIASGGFTYFADKLMSDLALDAARANVLEIRDNKLTGKVLGDIVDAKAKADTLLELAKEYQIPHSQTVAMGDGANDLVMMHAAHLGVAYKAKPLVLAKADTTICASGLDCLIHWLS